MSTHQRLSILPNTTRWALSLAVVGLTLAQTSSAIAGGQQLWVSRQAGPDDQIDRPSAIVVSPGGSKDFVTGETTHGNGNTDFGTVAYSASTGAKLWDAQYNGPADNFDFATSIAMSPDGSRVFVTGASVARQSFFDYVTIAYNTATGQQLWLARFDGPSHGYDAAYSVATSPDGASVFVTGWSESAEGHNDYGTVAYDASSGEQLWQARYKGLGTGGYDVAYSLAVSPGGDAVFVTGWSEGDNGYNDYATVAYRASSGTEFWTARYNGPGDGEDEGWRVTTSPDGSRVLVTGNSAGVGTDQDFATLAYDAETGAQIWLQRYDGPARSSDGATNLSASPGGTSLFVTGFSTGTTGYYNYATVAYDSSTGAQLWVRRYNGPGHRDDVPASVAVAPGGAKVYVTGSSGGAQDKLNFVTIAYRASSGDLLWLSGYNGPQYGDDQAYGLAVSPGGAKVFVTGASPGQLGDEDYVTVAYSA